MNDSIDQKIHQLSNKLDSLYNQVALGSLDTEIPEISDSSVNTLLNDPYIYTSAIVLLVGFGFLVFMVIYLRSKVERLSEDAYIQLLSVFLLIIATMYLTSVGYAQAELAPAFGIIGAIAGYLLGRQNSEKKEKIQEEKKVAEIENTNIAETEQ